MRFDELLLELAVRVRPKVPRTLNITSNWTDRRGQPASLPHCIFATSSDANCVVKSNQLYRSAPPVKYGWLI